MGMCEDLCLCTGHVGPTRVLNKPFSRLPTRRTPPIDCSFISAHKLTGNSQSVSQLAQLHPGD